ncbi:hypothetical protein [Rhodospirillaceae bacterium SYSU D60014]|uniref:hypothetical protein n=1 Tax=Virgifigura deserti TaxID=2268457 RepID=UPI000E6757D2
MTANLASRIDAMFLRDRLFAWGFVLVLWLVVGFVFFSIYPLAPSDGVRTVMVVSAIVLLVFNTAAIFAMVRHYAHDKEFIYGLDIRHLDERRAAASVQGGVRQPAE